MTQMTAIVVHDLMENPERWNEKDGSITNGYYRISLDGAKYSMGSSDYMSEPADQESLRKAVRAWRHEGDISKMQRANETNKVPAPYVPEKRQDIGSAGPLTVRPQTGDNEKEALKDFMDTVRKAHRAFSVHGDATVFSNGVGSALQQADAMIRGGRQ